MGNGTGSGSGAGAGIEKEAGMEKGAGSGVAGASAANSGAGNGVSGGGAVLPSASPGPSPRSRFFSSPFQHEVPRHRHSSSFWIDRLPSLSLWLCFCILCALVFSASRRDPLTIAVGFAATLAWLTVLVASWTRCGAWCEEGFREDAFARKNAPPPLQMISNRKKSNLMWRNVSEERGSTSDKVGINV
jgi:hypothetical protein